MQASRKKTPIQVNEEQERSWTIILTMTRSLKKSFIII